MCTLLTQNSGISSQGPLLFDSGEYDDRRRFVYRRMFVSQVLELLAIFMITLATIHLVANTNTRIELRILLIVVVPIGIFMLSVSYLSSTMKKIGSLPLKISRDGIWISAALLAPVRKKLRYVPVGDIEKIELLRLTDTARPVAFQIVTKHRKRLSSGLRGKEEMKRLIALFEEEFPDLCEFKTTYVDKG